MTVHTRDIAQDTAHRPWPLPSRPWVMFQSWQQLLFMHWPLPYAQLRLLVPPQLELEQFGGSAWIGMTPFLLTGLRPRGLPGTPAIPFISEFPELNLRTYVRAGGRSGIFFFSLDAASTLAVMGARAAYRLPYFPSDMSLDERDGWIDFRSRRRSAGAELDVRYRAAGQLFHATERTFEHFATERYALFTVSGDGQVSRGDIHHAPWALQTAEAELTLNTVPSAHGITLPAREPVVHFAARQDTLIWWPTAATA